MFDRQSSYNKIELLVDRGARVNSKCSDSSYPLHVAIRSMSDPTDTKLIELLISKGADVNGRANPFGTTPLCDLANGYNFRKIKAAEVLIKNGATVNVACSEHDGESPLAYAVNHNNLELIELLLSKGAKINEGNVFSALINLNFYCDFGFKQPKDKLQMVDLLISKGADLNNRDDHGRTPLMIAAYEEKGISRIFSGKGR